MTYRNRILHFRTEPGGVVQRKDDDKQNKKKQMFQKNVYGFDA